jgi:hypothetical protein
LSKAAIGVDEKNGIYFIDTNVSFLKDAARKIPHSTQALAICVLGLVDSRIHTS